MNLRILLTLHGLVTLAAGVVLIAAPDLIPGAVGVEIPPDAYLVCYLLGVAELAFARGVDAAIWANVTLRGAVIALFIRYGLRQKGHS